MGFEPQIKMIVQNIRPDRQTILFSATFPKQIESLAKKILKTPLEIVVGERSTVNKDITQVVEVHDEEDKFMRLLQLLGVWYDKGSVLVFVDKQEKCDQLFHDLLKSGYPCLSLHGGKDQVDRDHTLHEFKTLIKKVMIATSVAGRGLDVPEIVVVVNYNCPNHMEDYVHRVGRTGRAGRKGTAYTFISPVEEQYSPIMIKALQKAEQAIPVELQQMFEEFKSKVDRGEATWIKSHAGFVGKGFTFDASEMNEAQKMASMQRKQYDIEQGIFPDRGDEEVGMADDEFGADDDDEKKADVAMAVAAAAAAAAAGGGGPSAGGGGLTTTMGTLQPSLSPAAMANLTPLERAKMLAASLTLGKGLPGASTVTLPPLLVGGAGASTGLVGLGAAAPVAAPSMPMDPKAALARAKLIAQQMSRGGLGLGAAVELGPDGKEMAHFADEVEINDYPPQVSQSSQVPPQAHECEIVHSLFIFAALVILLFPAPYLFPFPSNYYCNCFFFVCLVNLCLCRRGAKSLNDHRWMTSRSARGWPSYPGGRTYPPARRSMPASGSYTCSSRARRRCKSSSPRWRS